MIIDANLSELGFFHSTTDYVLRWLTVPIKDICSSLVMSPTNNDKCVIHSKNQQISSEKNPVCMFKLYLPEINIF